MTDQDYLNRALGRIADDGLMEAQKAVSEAQVAAASRGALHGSRTFLLYDKAVGDVFAETLAKMTTLAFNKTGGASDEVCGMVEAAGRRLIDEAAAWIEKRFAVSSGAFGYAGPSGAKLKSILTRMLDRAVDDFRHGIQGETALKKDPVVSVVSQIINSPNAVQQTTVGEHNQQIVQQQLTAIQKAVDDLLASEEYKTLAPERKIALKDTADVLSGEVKSAAPDTGKIRRWSQRLAALAQDFGMHVAAAVFLNAMLAAVGVVPAV
jgi:hypothetical protein